MNVKERSGPMLAGQSAIVTGAGSGIGRSIAEALSSAGARVTVNDVSEERAQSVAKIITSAGGNALGVGADVSDEDDVERLFRTTLEKFGSLDILVSNAGIQSDAPFLEMSLQDWNRVIAVNLTGGFLCARAAARQFVLQGVRDSVSRSAGKILFTSSVHQVIPWSEHVNYAASKGGLMQLMRSAAQELSHRKIRVNAIAPGAIKTAINRKAWSTEEARDSLLKLIPYGRLGEPEDIARAAVWLVSDDADYVQGATLFVDGGMTLYPGFSEGHG